MNKKLQNVTNFLYIQNILKEIIDSEDVNSHKHCNQLYSNKIFLKRCELNFPLN